MVYGCASGPPSVKGPPPEPSVTTTKTSVIEQITFSEEENYTRVLIQGSDPLAPPFYKLQSEPLTLIIDVPNVDLTPIKGPIKVDNGTIGEILARPVDNKGRIEIGLLQMVNYNISKEEKTLIIDIEKGKKTVKADQPSPATKKEETLSPPAGAEPVKKAKEILNVLMEQKKDYINVNIVADGTVGNYDAFKLDSPPRLVIDLWEVGSRYPKKSIRIKNPFVKEIRIGHYPDKVRLVFDSLQPQMAPYQINRMKDRLIVSMGNVPLPSEPQVILPEKTVKAEAPSKPGKPAILSSIDFKQLDHKSRVVLSLSTEDPQFKSYLFSKNIIAVDIKNAFVPKHLLRGLDTREFDSPVTYVSLQNMKVGKANDVRVLIKLKEETPFETTTEKKTVFVDVQKPKKVEAKTEPLPEPKPETAPGEVKKEEAQKEEAKKGEEKPAPELKPAEKGVVLPEEKSKPIKKEEEIIPEKVYSGRKISLDFKDADIKNILRLVAEVSNLNIIAGEDVTGKVTMRLVDVPWDQALDLVLQSRGLGMSRAGNVIRIAPLETLKREVQSELEAKRAKERLEDLSTELIPVNYASAKELVPQVKGILSERGDVKVDERTNIMIVKEIPRNMPAVRTLLKSLDSKTPQVLIEARIVEAGLTFQRALGITWGFLLGGGTASLGGGLPGNNIVDFSPILSQGVAGPAGVLEFIFSRGTIQQLDIQIAAHENKGDLKIISSPKIATLDNKEASIEVGLRIPYSKQTPEGTITEDFVEANTKLTVTPHVTNDGHIKMNIKVKKDAPNAAFTSDQGTPAIDKKEAITEAMVKDNGVVVIAGIYSIEKSENMQGIPLFSKIPLLGWLFKRENVDDLRKDLLIFISPKLMKDNV
jgi:type IV pilus assembly protein PilQ